MIRWLTYSTLQVVAGASFIYHGLMAGFLQNVNGELYAPGVYWACGSLAVGLLATWRKG